MAQPDPNEACDPREGTTALILSGGGANGAYEVGVVQALCSGNCKVTGYRPFNPDIISGTSIGAFNASVLVSRMATEGHGAADYLEQIWVNDIPRDDSTTHNHVFRYRADPFEFLNPQLALSQPLQPVSSFAKDSLFFARDWTQRAMRFFGTREESLETRLLKLVDVSTLIDNEPTLRLIHEHILPAAILQSDKSLKLATTNWDTGELQIFTNRLGLDPREVPLTEDLVPLAVLASAAIPGVFPSVTIEGVNYVDGGTVMNTPLTPAIRAGASTIHLIYLDPDVRDIPLEALQSTIDVMSRMFTILLAVSADRDVAAASRINKELAAFAELKGSNLAQTADGRRLLEAVSERFVFGRTRTHTPLLIHRYHPTEDLSGMLGMLNFDRDRIAGLIKRGYHDAVEHDCDASQCLMPDGSMGSGGKIHDDAPASIES
jgi:NTE family protein